MDFRRLSVNLNSQIADIYHCDTTADILVILDFAKASAILNFSIPPPFLFSVAIFCFLIQTNIKPPILTFKRN